MRPEDLVILDVLPRVGVPGGEVLIDCRGFEPGLPFHSKVVFGNTAGEIVSASGDRIIARVPEDSGDTGVFLISGSRSSAAFPFTPAIRLAAGLHPVSNPVVAPDGTVITTISGSRGQEVSQPLVRVTREGDKVPFSCQIMNPTGLAFGPDGQLYVSSRNDGIVYRYTDFETLDVVAEDLGVSCGIAFDSQGRLYVGDRTGRIYRVDPARGEREEFARLEPSVSAYHVAIDRNDVVYVTGPTFALRDSIYRIAPDGCREAVFRGLARPQGMAFLPDGDLLIAACYEGKKGLFRFSPAAGGMDHVIAAPTLVGVAVSGRDLFLTDSQSLLWVRSWGGVGMPVYRDRLRRACHSSWGHQRRICQSSRS
ncbi:MAG: SMP-30/gluconolactonase/LRE family protein [Acidobacteria bacterium]|nr:SMP-30/gluconolactonase/LRE family protein [Acidobacteriota bacterium]